MITIATGKYTRSYLLHLRGSGAQVDDGYHFRLSDGQIDDSCFENGSGVTCYDPEAVCNALKGLIAECKSGNGDAAEAAICLTAAALAAYKTERETYSDMLDRDVLRVISNALAKAIDHEIQEAEAEAAKSEGLPFEVMEDAPSIEAALSCAYHVREVKEMRRVRDIINGVISKTDDLSIEIGGTHG